MKKIGSRRDYDYFKEFVRCADYANQAALLLEKSFLQFDPTVLSEQIRDMHAIEHAADVAKHEMMNHLVKAFITPIEREDIMELSQNIDDVVDGIEDVMLHAYMFSIPSMHGEALEFTKVIVNCCGGLKALLEEFHNFKKSSKIYELIVEINRLEEEGDQLYTKMMRKLFTTSTDPIYMMIWREMYNRMEKCCDACEHVANAVESAVLKNS